MDFLTCSCSHMHSSPAGQVQSEITVKRQHPAFFRRRRVGPFGSRPHPTAQQHLTLPTLARPLVVPELTDAAAHRVGQLHTQRNSRSSAVPPGQVPSLAALEYPHAQPNSAPRAGNPLTWKTHAAESCQVVKSVLSVMQLRWEIQMMFSSQAPPDARCEAVRVS